MTELEPGQIALWHAPAARAVRTGDRDGGRGAGFGGRGGPRAEEGSATDPVWQVQLKNRQEENGKEAEHAKPPLPPPEQMAMMIQTSVVALSQANLTGNFTVLHALGAPGFQQSNPPAKLAEIFKNLREQNIDLTPVILFSPVLLREPAINEQGMLHLVGYYKTAPQQVHFELLFQPVSGQWRLFGISVRTLPANQPAAHRRRQAKKTK